MKPSLEHVLRTLGRQGRLGFLTLAFGAQGFQGAHREPGADGFKIGITDDPVRSLLDALSPPHGKTWDEHLGITDATTRDVIEDEAIEDDFSHLI